MPVLEGRYIDSNGYSVSYWDTDSGVIIRYVVFAVIIGLIFGYIFGGYFHAKARLRKGLPPLAYHRCLVSRRPSRASNGWGQPQYGNYPQGGYNPNSEYPMHNMPPPPIYDPTRPPVYEPPEGASKVDPSQWRNEPTRRPADTSGPAPEYDAPSGPPPNR